MANYDVHTVYTLCLYHDCDTKNGTTDPSLIYDPKSFVLIVWRLSIVISHTCMALVRRDESCACVKM